MKYRLPKFLKFSSILKDAEYILSNLTKVNKSIKIIINKIVYQFDKFIKFISKSIFKGNHYTTNIKRFNFLKFYKFLITKIFNFFKIKIKSNLIKNRKILIHFFTFLIFFSVVYVSIPIFYKYENSKIEKLICKNINTKCTIKEKISYNFYPTPRLKIKNLTIDESIAGGNKLASIKETIITISLKNLLNKKKQNFKSVVFNNFEIKFNTKNFEKYLNNFIKNENFFSMHFKKGKIIFSNGENYISTVSKANLKFILKESSSRSELNGIFLNKPINIVFKNKKKEKKFPTELLIKMPSSNLFIKINYVKEEKNEDLKNANISIKINKNKFTSIFDYKDKEININKSNFRNPFLDGKVSGIIKFVPYFDFDLDLSLSSLNFTKLYNYFLSFDDDRKKNLFKISNKINGNLNLSSDKIYSSYNLVKSFESQLKFNNGNILIEQFLINLGKLGAADVVGEINNNNKFTNFKYESNIFVDNRKKFLSKFGIYNKKDFPSNIYVLGNFNLESLKNSFYELSDDKKLSNADTNYIENEFNDSMLEEGFKNLFNFPKFKDFIKAITAVTN